MKNEVYLRRKNKVLLKEGSGELTPEYMITMLKNIESLGYTFTRKLVKRIVTLQPEKAEKFFKEVILTLKTIVGARVKYEPMYPNFPEQVMKASDDELYFNAMMHYFGDFIGVRILPEYEKEERKELKERIALKKIDLGSNEDFESLIKGLLAAKTSISETDKTDITNTIKSYRNTAQRLIPDQIPLKENVALLCGLLMEHTDIAEEYASKILKTATDVLRLAAQLSDGDISLADKTEFKSFSKKERRLMLSALDSDKSSTEKYVTIQRTMEKIRRNIASR